jgi:hypothetical protein
MSKMPTFNIQNGNYFLCNESTGISKFLDTHLEAFLPFLSCYHFLKLFFFGVHCTLRQVLL